MVGFIVVALGFGGYFTVRYINDAPERLMKAADDEYGRRNWDQARKLYEQLAREHPSFGTRIRPSSDGCSRSRWLRAEHDLDRVRVAAVDRGLHSFAVRLERELVRDDDVGREQPGREHVDRTVDRVTVGPTREPRR